jgi:hypothetical protein
MLSSREPIDVATARLSASGPVNNVPLGAAHRATSLFYDNLLIEIQALICTNKGYAAERKELSAKAEAGSSGSLPRTSRKTLRCRGRA